MTLMEEVRIYNSLREQLLNGGFDLTEEDQCLYDSLEGMTDVREQIAALIRDARRAGAMAGGLAEIIKDNRARLSRLEVRAERLRKLAFDAMQSCGIPKVESPDLTISIAKGTPRVVIKDEAAVPDSLCTIVRTPKKKEIGDLLDSFATRGEFVPYAEWSNAQPILKVHSR